MPQTLSLEEGQIALILSFEDDDLVFETAHELANTDIDDAALLQSIVMGMIGVALNDHETIEEHAQNMSQWMKERGIHIGKPDNDEYSANASLRPKLSVIGGRDTEDDKGGNDSNG